MWKDIIIGLTTGLISGGISGYVVYILTKRREKKYEAYHYCQDFLFTTLEKCEMYIPSELLGYVAIINKDKNSLWRKNIQQILDITNPYGYNHKVFSEKETELSDCVISALEELQNWKKKNHLH